MSMFNRLILVGPFILSLKSLFAFTNDFVDTCT